MYYWIDFYILWYHWYVCLCEAILEKNFSQNEKKFVRVYCYVLCGGQRTVKDWFGSMHGENYIAYNRKTRHSSLFHDLMMLLHVRFTLFSPSNPTSYTRSTRPKGETWDREATKEKISFSLPLSYIVLGTHISVVFMHIRKIIMLHWYQTTALLDRHM